MQLGLFLLPLWSPAIAEESKTVISKVYVVDRKYKSMQGPASTQPLSLGDPNRKKLLWIEGYEAVIVDEKGRPAPQEFMCHSNLDVNSQARMKAWGMSRPPNTRFFTISQGQQALRFPRGFGIPLFSTEALSLTTQVLNLNEDNPKRKIRHKVTLRYAEDSPDSPHHALFQTSAYGLKLLQGQDGVYGADPLKSLLSHGPSCLPGQRASFAQQSDGAGRTFTGHWVVKPGREVNRTRATKLMELPYDSTIHYILVHLHPFAESLELLDSTAGKSLYKAEARNFAGKVGLERVGELSSPEGIPVFKDHEYELVSVYNNTSGEDQDAMAVMYLFLKDKEFDIAKARAQLATQGGNQ